MIHEGAHLIKIGEPDGESYCGGNTTYHYRSDRQEEGGGFSCTGPCGKAALNVADNWSQWIHCVWLLGENAKAAGAKPD
jgi:hypothetical protein